MPSEVLLALAQRAGQMVAAAAITDAWAGPAGSSGPCRAAIQQAALPSGTARSSGIAADVRAQEPVPRSRA